MNGELRLVLAGGGTGGHVYPLVAVARALLARHPGAQVRFVGERGRMEAELVPHEGFDLTLLDLPPANAPAWRKALRSARWLSGTRAAARLMREVAPAAVVGTGGQVCAPVLWAARGAGVRRIILEPNAVPGKANRLLAQWTRPDLIGIQMPEARQHFPAGLAVEELGYPVRPAVLTAGRAEAQAALGLDPGRRTLLVFGGSLGSGRINDALLGLLPGLQADWAKAVQVVHIGGHVNARTLPAEQAAGLAVSYHYHPYLHDMHLALAAADLVVGRAGAASLAELTARGLPAVLVPLPGVADDHQTRNAAWMAGAGAAVVVPDAEFTPQRLEAELAALLADSSRLAALAAASGRLGRPGAADAVVDAIERLNR